MTLYLDPCRIRNVGILGLPSFNKSLASGFSVGNGIFIPKLFKPGNNPWKISGSFSTGTVGWPQEIVGYNAPVDFKLPILGIRQGNVLGMFASSTGESWDICIGNPDNNGISSYVINPNVTYFVEMGWNGAEYYVNAGTSQESLTRIITVANTAPIYQGNYYWYYGYHRYSPDGYEIFNGTINLQYCKVEINDQLWWSGISDAVKLMPGDNDIRAVGDVTVNGHVISNFSNENYFTIPHMFDPGSNPWERVIKFTTSDDVTTNQCLTGSSISGYGASIHIINATLNMWLSTASGNWDIYNNTTPSTNTLLPNQTYWVRQKFTGSQYVVDVSTTGAFTGEETNYITVNSSTAIASFRIYMGDYGAADVNTYYFKGSIDLSGCYVNINGNRFWSGVVSAAQYDYDYVVKISDVGKHGLYFGNRAIKSAYLGGTHVYQYNSYNPSSIIYNRVGGGVVESVTLLPGRYKLEMVGAGGGQGGFATNSGVAFNSGGAGSGAAVVGEMVVNTTTVFEVTAGNVGSTNRGYVGTGNDGGSSFIREKDNPGIYYTCNSAGTGSGGWSGHGTGGYLQEDGGFWAKWVPNGATFYSNGLEGEGGSRVGRWGNGGASVYQGFGAGAGPANNNGTAGMVKITYVGYI